MDFAFTDEQLAVSEAAVGLLSGLVVPDRITAVEQTDDVVDRELWAAWRRPTFSAWPCPKPTAAGGMD